MDQKVEKIKALFLNKIDHLRWYYFQLDLNRELDTPNVKMTLNQQQNRDFLSQINLEKRTFEGGHASFQNILNSLLLEIREHPRILKEVARRIYDLNEIPNESRSSAGIIGRLNHYTQAWRNERFHSKIFDRHFRSEPDNIVAVAEGDSWFQFPGFRSINLLEDIIDHLIRFDDLAVKSLAAGGDWLSNIFYSGEYIEDLPRIAPDVLMISGGGNDLVGPKLGNMVRNPLQVGRRDLYADDQQAFRELLSRRSEAPHLDQGLYRRGLELLADEFFEFLNLCMIQYILLFYNLSKASRYRRMLILTHGYDFAIPSGTGSSGRGFIQRLTNRVLGSGKWLHRPLLLKGITDPVDQRAVMYTAIQEFNEMLVLLATYKDFPNVFHIDCRGTAQEHEHWYDELHLTGDSYERIAHVYHRCMRENLRMEHPSQQKVYRVNESMNFSAV